MKEQYIVFSDHIGRVVCALLVEDNEKENKLVVSNPVIVHVEPNPQTKQLQVHTFPYIFVEVIKKDGTGGNTWTFDKDTIAVSDVELEDRLMEAVVKVNDPAKQSVPQPEQGDAKVVNLFDNE